MKQKIPKCLILLFAICLCSLLPTTSEAAFGVSVSGEAQQLIQPVSAERGDLEANFYSVWSEGLKTIDSDLQVDHLGQAGHFAVKDLDGSEGGLLSAGTQVNSYVAHLDLPRNDCNRWLCCNTKHTGHEKKGGDLSFWDDLEATLTFDSSIVGISLFTASLDASDQYGIGTSYSTGNKWRGLGTHKGGDAFTISNDGKTLELNWNAIGKDFDQIRIFTAGGGFGTPVPEPASIVMWGTGLFALSIFRNRRGR